MISTEERNKIVVNKKADMINKRHHGRITINTNPAEYQGSIVTIPALSGCSAFSFNREIIDDTPGQPVRVAKRDIYGGGVRGFADLDERLQGKANPTPAHPKQKAKEPSEQIQARVSKKIDKMLESADEQALEDFFLSLLD